MIKYAGVIIESDAESLDKIFTYGITDEMILKIKVGQQVKVPFGNGNKSINAYIFDLYDKIDFDLQKLKFIKSIVDLEPILSENDIKLIYKMKQKYICTYIECIKTILPSAITNGMKNKLVKLIFTGKKLEGKFDKENYQNIYRIVSQNNGKFTKSILNKDYKLSISSINTMIKHGFLVQDDKIINRYSNKIYKAYETKKLNFEQQNAFDKIIKSNNKISLIHGVTGSGKTEIYMHLVSYMLKNNKDSIILVPEISLTPQMIERFKGRFGNKIAIFHSKLSDGEKTDEWIRIKQNNVKIVIGARSAIFMPFNNLGLIVIDEEHEATYKSDSSPKYTAFDIAKFKSELTGCKVVLGSATPSINTYYKALRNEMNLITIKNRVDGASFPEIKIVDMRDELSNNNKTMFSKELYCDIESCLYKKEQTIIFLNRRGFSTFVSCRKCGYVFKCDNCDIALTYHQNGEYLKCHYCGKKINAPKICPKCKSKYVKYFGIGTEKVEKELKKYFPSARILRMDFDTTRKKNSYEVIYEKFKNKEADILVGTQMIAKGLDFDNVTLVGVVAADLSLNLPDFRCNERTFQLINQVSGRSGRGKKKGKVVIQTYNPTNYSIKYSANGDYESFFKTEILLRKQMNYPPFTNIFVINMTSQDENLLIKNIQKASDYLKNFLSKYDKIELLGPSSCVLSKIKNNYRWQIVLKGDININLAKKIKKIVYECTKQDYNNIRINVDINPNNML